MNKGIMDYDFYLLDLDGCIVKPITNNVFRTTGHAEDWQFIDGRDSMLRILVREPFMKQTAIVTNQGGVAFGYFTEEDICKEVDKVIDSIDANAAYICYSYPKATIEKHCIENDMRRKPNPGMLLHAMEWHNFNKDQSCLIGDREEDKLAAERAGIQFFKANVFFEQLRNEITDYFEQHPRYDEQ